MRWDFWVITGKLRVVFPLENFGVTEGLQIVYRGFIPNFNWISMMLNCATIIFDRARFLPEIWASSPNVCV